MIRADISILLTTVLLACSPQGANGAPDAGRPADGPAGAGAGYDDPATARLDVERLLEDIAVLAADSMEGRRTGTAGSARARRYILERFAGIGLDAFAGGPEQSFTFRGPDGRRHTGVNVVGYIEGTENPDRYLVVTAHYDHLGIQGGQIYNGADDNASGTAGLLALADWFRRHPPAHSIIFAATDAEERMGAGGTPLQGARAFVAAPPVPLDAIIMNVNMDMVSRSADDELFAAGTYHSPFLRPILEPVAERAPVTLTFGHDSPDLGPRDDWTMLSDHGAFHEAGLPFIYFGVADHEDYHRPTDTVENIDPDFYGRAMHAILYGVRELDRHLAEIEREAAAGAGR